MRNIMRTTTRRLIPHAGLLLSLAVALAVLGATIGEAGAEKSPGSYQNAFTGACRNHGGTPKRVRTRVVKCTLADGTVITCNFNFNPPSCTKALTGLPSSPVTDPFAPPTDGNEQPPDGGHPAGGGGAVDPTGGNEQPSAGGNTAGGGAAVDPSGGVDPTRGAGASDGSGVTITAYDGDGTHAKHHGKHRRHGHGKGRKH